MTNPQIKNLNRWIEHIDTQCFNFCDNWSIKLLTHKVIADFPDGAVKSEFLSAVESVYGKFW